MIEQSKAMLSWIKEGWKKSRPQRFWFLVSGAILGLVLFCLFYLWVFPCFFDDFKNGKNNIANSILLLILSLPVLTILWIYRTYDTQEQIKKAQEQINLSILSKGLDLITSEDVKNKINGLSLLLNLKKRQVFQEQIEFAISNIDFRGENLSGLNLSGLDLSGIDFTEAFMVGVNLKGTILKNAILNKVIFKLHTAKEKLIKRGGGNRIEIRSGIGNWENANFEGADLSSIDLQPDHPVSIIDGVNNINKANLKNCILFETNLEDVNLEGMNLSGTKLEWAKIGRENKLYTCTVSLDTTVFSADRSFFSEEAQEILREGDRRREREGRADK